MGGSARKEIMSMNEFLKIMDNVIEDLPSEADYAIDGRYTWPNRWEELKRRVNAKTQWFTANENPVLDGEYLVQHWGMKNGLRTRPYVDRDYFENGSWQTHDYISHWANIEYPETSNTK